MHTTIRSWSGLGAGVTFTLVTAWVLLEDVYHGAPLNSKHIMTAAVLGGTIYYGHKVWPQLRMWRIPSAVFCIALFVAGTVTCVLMSAGRNAETVVNKVLVAQSSNTDRAELQRVAAEAREAYQRVMDGEDRSLKEARMRYDSALKAEDDECKTGQGSRCLSRRNVTAERRKDVESAEGVRQAMIDRRRADLEAAEAKLRQAPPTKVANADIKASATLLSKLPYVSLGEAELEALLQLFYPFSQSLFCEIAAICGFSIGFGHAPRSDRRVANGQRWLPSPSVTDAVTVTVTEPSTVPMTVNTGVSEPVATPASVSEPLSFQQPTPAYLKAKKKKPTDVQLVLDALERAGKPVSNDELAALLACSKAESSKRVSNCGDAIVIGRNGRCYAIQPNYRMV